jgi:hypothetical protein
VLDIILMFTQREEWQVRHGGMLGLKYVVAVRRDLAELILPQVLPAIIRGYVFSMFQCAVQRRTCVRCANLGSTNTHEQPAGSG